MVVEILYPSVSLPFLPEIVFLKFSFKTWNPMTSRFIKLRFPFFLRRLFILLCVCVCVEVPKSETKRFLCVSEYIFYTPFARNKATSKEP